MFLFVFSFPLLFFHLVFLFRFSLHFLLFSFFLFCSPPDRPPPPPSPAKPPTIFIHSSFSQRSWCCPLSLSRQCPDCEVFPLPPSHPTPSLGLRDPGLGVCVCVSVCVCVCLCVSVRQVMHRLVTVALVHTCFCCSQTGHAQLITLPTHSCWLKSCPKRQLHWTWQRSVVHPNNSVEKYNTCSSGSRVSSADIADVIQQLRAEVNEVISGRMDMMNSMSAALQRVTTKSVESKPYRISDLIPRNWEGSNEQGDFRGFMSCTHGCKLFQIKENRCLMVESIDGFDNNVIAFNCSDEEFRSI